MKQTLTTFLLSLGLSLTAQAAPLGLTPGSTQLPQAKALLGEPQSSPIPEARYQFAAPAGSGYASVELYIGRRSQVVEIAQYSYEPATDAAALKTSLKQKEPDLRYSLASGDTAEVFFATKTRIILNKEGKAKALEYLSNNAMKLLLSEVSPLTADRSTPAGAYRALVASIYAGKEAELTTELQAASASLLVALDGATVTLPAAKAKNTIVKLNHPLFGGLEFVFIPSEDGWRLSQINGLKSPLEKLPSTPRAALSLYLKSLAATPAPKVTNPPEVSAMSAWGDTWYTKVNELSVTSITLDGNKATLLLSGERSAQVSCVLEAKTWRVTEVKPQ